MNINELLKNTYSPRTLFLSFKTSNQKEIRGLYLYSNSKCWKIAKGKNLWKEKVTERKQDAKKDHTKAAQEFPPKELGQGLLILAVNKWKESNKNLSLDPL